MIFRERNHGRHRGNLKRNKFPEANKCFQPREKEGSTSEQ